MSEHNLATKLNRAHFPNTGRALYQPTQGYMLGWGTTAGNGNTSGWAPGALFIRHTAATKGQQVLINGGNKTTATWVAAPAVDAANAWSTVQSFLAGFTVATTQDAIVLKPDGLQVGGVKIPQDFPIAKLTVDISNATKVIWNFFVAKTAWQVTGLEFIPDIVEGKACAGVIVKAVGTTAPATATTPLHSDITSARFDFTAAANVPQLASLTTGTTALQLTSGNRLALVLSTGLTAGSGTFIVRGKRI